MFKCVYENISLIFNPVSSNQENTYHWMVVGITIVYGHVFEIGLHVLVEESLYLVVVEVRVDEDRPNIRFNYVRKTLYSFLVTIV